MKTRTLRIGGMSCVNCQNKIEKALQAAPGVTEARVSYTAGTATVTYDPAVISLDGVEDIVTRLGYDVLTSPAEEAGATASPGSSGTAAAARTAGLLVIILAASLIVGHFSPALSAAFPTAEAGMSLGMMFLIGLITSVHCVGMCGGINLSQTLGGGRGGATFAAALPSLLYNGGRVVSYTVIGGIVGAVGSAFSLSGQFRGLVQLAAGVFMVIMGVNMLGIFPVLRVLTPRLPRALAARLDRVKARSAADGRRRGPLVVGLLNGLMPCGPLQAMQIYALSTGSPVQGAAAMLLFSLGTVPLMFGLGALGTFLSARPGITRRVMTVGACVVAVMGVTMFAQGWTLSGFPLVPGGGLAAGVTPAAAGNTAAAGGIQIVDGVQIVTSTLSPGRYPAITVQAGVPVRWTINAPAGSINGCNNAMIIPAYNIQYRFKTGDNVIEFTPDKTGTFSYSCWMGMIRSSITVVADAAALAEAANAPDPLAPVTAGYTIPTAELAVAEPAEYQGNSIQRVSITLTDEGFTPAVVIVEAGVPALWLIDNQSLEEGSAELRVPLYTAILPLDKLAVNQIGLTPEEDFEFSTGDSIFYGYLKVVDDINSVDLESVRKEVAAFETLVYPDEFFAEAQAAAAGCCGGAGGS